MLQSSSNHSPSHPTRYSRRRIVESLYCSRRDWSENDVADDLCFDSVTKLDTFPETVLRTVEPLEVMDNSKEVTEEDVRRSLLP